MSIEFIDGFDHYNIGDILAKWSSTSGSGAYAMATGRFGGQALQINRFGGPSYLFKSVNNLTHFAIGFSLKLSSGTSSNANFISFRSASNEQISVSVKSDGTLSFSYNGTPLTGVTNSGTFAALTYNQWNYIEVLISVSTSVAANSCKIFVNGTLYQTLNSGQNTNQQASGYITAFSLDCDSAYDPSNPWFFDDLYILTIDADTPGVLGDCKIETLYPTGAGTNTQWTPDSGNNYARVNEAHADNDTSYVYSGTAGQIDTYVFGDLSSIPTTIHGVQSTIWMKKDSTGTRQVEPTTYIGGTAYNGTASTTMYTSYNAYTSIFRTNPATTVAWTGSGVNGAEFGFTVSI